jgi:hypothetical protein
MAIVKRLSFLGLEIWSEIIIWCMLRGVDSLVLVRLSLLDKANVLIDTNGGGFKRDFLVE